MRFHLLNRLCKATSSLRLVLAGVQCPSLPPDLLTETVGDVHAGLSGLLPGSRVLSCPARGLLCASVFYRVCAHGHAGLPNPVVSVVFSWEQTQLNGSQDTFHLYYLISPECTCSVSATLLFGDSCAQ